MRLAMMMILFAACSQDGAATEAPAPIAAAAAQAPEGASTQGSAGAGGDVAASEVVLTWKGGSLTLGEVDEVAQGELIRQEIEYLQNRYQTRGQALDQLMMEKLLEAEVAEKGVADIDALITAEVQGRITPATEAEVQEMYAALQRRLRGAPLEQVRDLVVAEVDNRKMAQAFQIYIEQLRTRYDVQGGIPFPDLPRIAVATDGDPQLGPDDAPITIVQFAEYQCGYCGSARETLDQVMAQYEGKVRMVYRDYPLGFHDRAVPAAVAANCAGEQGKYWEMHGRLMDNQTALDEDTLQSHAKNLDLNLEKWAQCRADPAQAAEVQKDFEDGQKAGVSGTPAFFINGIMLSGAQPLGQFQTIIDRELEQG